MNMSCKIIWFLCIFIKILECSKWYQSEAFGGIFEAFENYFLKKKVQQIIFICNENTPTFNVKVKKYFKCFIELMNYRSCD